MSLYFDGIMFELLEVMFCLDFSGDGEIMIYDVVLLKSCFCYGIDYIYLG